jgi:hypothetical protein
MQDDMYTYLSLSRLYDTALGLENAGSRTWNTVLITIPYPILPWINSQLEYSWLVSCLSHEST